MKLILDNNESKIRTNGQLWTLLSFNKEHVFSLLVLAEDIKNTFESLFNIYDRIVDRELRTKLASST